MMHTNENEAHKNGNNQQASHKGDSESGQKTDPQENMEGPLSSAMESIGHAFETGETKEDADVEKDEKM